MNGCSKVGFAVGFFAVSACASVGCMSGGGQSPDIPDATPTETDSGVCTDSCQPLHGEGGTDSAVRTDSGGGGDSQASDAGADSQRADSSAPDSAAHDASVADTSPPDTGVADTGHAPFCGNGTCDPGETCSSCPSDCGACPPVCGNGVCEAGESSANCCTDCGCQANYACQSNACAPACTQETFTLSNHMSDNSYFCGVTSSIVTQYSYLLLNTSSGSFGVTTGGFMYDYVNLGQSDNGTFQCCYVDPVNCVGYTQQCYYQGAWSPCYCLQAQPWSVTATSCNATDVPLCN